MNVKEGFESRSGCPFAVFKEAHLVPQQQLQVWMGLKGLFFLLHLIQHETFQTRVLLVKKTLTFILQFSFWHVDVGYCWIAVSRHVN